MTVNQIAYLGLQEQMRANQASEDIRRTTNVETERANRAREAETERGNRAQEELQRQSLAETQRANLVREAENERSNRARESENERANRANEAIKQKQYYQEAYEFGVTSSRQQQELDARIGELDRRYDLDVQKYAWQQQQDTFKNDLAWREYIADSVFKSLDTGKSLVSWGSTGGLGVGRAITNKRSSSGSSQ